MHGKVLVTVVSLWMLLGASYPAAQGAPGPGTTVVDDDGRATVTDCDVSDPAHSTIGSAVAAAAPDATITVCPGSYVEQITIDKPIELLGARAGRDGRSRSGHESIITSTCPEVPCVPVLNIEGDHVVIDGFTFSVGAGPAVVVSETTDGHRIRNNIFRAQGVGLWARSEGGELTTIRRNLFLAEGAGIASDTGLNNAVIADNLFRGDSAAIEVWDTSDLVIENNDFLATWGVRLTGVGARVLHNNFDSTSFALGIGGEGSRDISIQANKIQDIGATAILFRENHGGTHGISIRNNTISHTRSAIVFDEGSIAGPVRVHHNVIARSDAGIVNNDATLVMAGRNFWGSYDGPTGWGTSEEDISIPGTSVSQNVLFFPWARGSSLSELVGCDNSRAGTDDLIVGTRKADILCGGAGVDDIDGRGGDDLIIGGSGSDMLLGGRGDDAMIGSHGNDTIAGERGYDSLQGLSGFDICELEPGGGREATCESTFREVYRNETKDALRAASLAFEAWRNDHEDNPYDSYALPTGQIADLEPGGAADQGLEYSDDVALTVIAASTWYFCVEGTHLQRPEPWFITDDLAEPQEGHCP